MLIIRSKVSCIFGRTSQGDVVGRVSAHYIALLSANIYLLLRLYYTGTLNNKRKYMARNSKSSNVRNRRLSPFLQQSTLIWRQLYINGSGIILSPCKAPNKWQFAQIFAPKKIGFWIELKILRKPIANLLRNDYLKLKREFRICRDPPTKFTNGSHFCRQWRLFVQTNIFHFNLKTLGKYEIVVFNYFLLILLKIGNY
jgi:hypothetical protein